MSLESQWLTYAKRIHALATCGIEFTESHYEKDRYDELQAIANQMLSELAESSVEPIRDLMLDGIDGYVTPKVDVRASVIKDDKILLVQEKTDQLWALPGGYADVGIGPAENAVKEVWEEAGIKVKATKLYAVRHKAKGEYKPDTRDFYKLLFLCEQCVAGDVEAGSEVLDAGYFSLDALPPLSTGRTVESDLNAAFLYREIQNRDTFFDDGELTLL